jgi:hypothetical protein
VASAGARDPVVADGAEVNMPANSNSSDARSMYLFVDRRTAEEAVSALVEAGVQAKRIDLLVQAKSQDPPSPAEWDRAIERAGMVGVVIGALAGIVLFAIPGIGSAVGTGFFAEVLTGGIMGCVAGGLAGSVTGAALMKIKAQETAYQARQCGTVLLVQDDGDREVICRIARSRGAVIA